MNDTTQTTLTSDSANVTPQGNSVPTPDSVTQPPAGQPQQGQTVPAPSNLPPNQPQEIDWSKVDWSKAKVKLTDIPQFQDTQAKIAKAAEERIRQTEEKYQRELAQMQALYQRNTSDFQQQVQPYLPAEARYEFQLAQEKQRADMYSAQLNSYQQEQAKQVALMKIATEYGADYNEVAAMTNPFEAEKHLLSSRYENEKKRNETLEQRLAALEANLTAKAAESVDRPDLGGGGGVSDQAILQQKHDDFLRQRQSGLALQVSQEARAKGITLDTRPLQVR
jgi:hypothetical protein